MAKFHSIKVLDIRKETKDCSVISFEIPADLKSEFQYKQGQHLTLRATIEGNEVRRSYSLCSSPIENQWKVAVTLQRVFDKYQRYHANTFYHQNPFGFRTKLYFQIILPQSKRKIDYL